MLLMEFIYEANIINNNIINTVIVMVKAILFLILKKFADPIKMAVIEIILTYHRVLTKLMSYSSKAIVSSLSFVMLKV